MSEKGRTRPMATRGGNGPAYICTFLFLSNFEFGSDLALPLFKQIHANESLKASSKSAHLGKQD